MTQQINQLQSKIMRRVYYSFGLRVLTSRVLLQAVLLVVGLYGVKVMVHVTSVINNLKTVEVGNLDNFMFNALTHTDVYTLLSIGIVVFSLLSFNFTVFKPAKMQRLQAI